MVFYCKADFLIIICFSKYLASLVSVVVFLDGKDSILVILIESSNVMKEKNHLGSIDGFW